MIYKYKVTLPGNKFFLREYEVKSDMRLYKLHEFLQNDLAFAPDQMVIFEGVDKNGAVLHEYGLFDMGDGSMDTVTIEKTIQRGESVLHYVYNLNKNLFLILTFVSEEEFIPRESYPRMMAEKGRNPDQFSSRYEDFDEETETLSAASAGGGDEGDVEYDDSELPEGEDS